MTKPKKTVTINSRLRGACIAEAKANLSGATQALRDDDIAAARARIAQALESMTRADKYTEEDAPSADDDPDQEPE